MKTASLFLPDLHEPEFVFSSFRLRSDGTLLKGGEPIHLPPKELATLRLLLTHAGQIVSPMQLKTSLWGDVHVTADSVPRCVSSLRAALMPDDCIQTIYKKGYRLTAAVHLEHGSAPETAPRLAVMPFAGGPLVPEHLGPAVAEETLVRLCRDFGARSAPFTLLARDSVATLAQQGRSAAQVGHALQADLVLTGTLRAQMSNYRLRAELIRVSDDAQLWVEDFLVPQAQTAGLECALAERLAFRLGMVAPGNGLSVASTDATGDPESEEAYARFQRGHQDLHNPGRLRMQDGLQNLLRATELDPTLTQAQVDLIHLCLKQSLFGYLSPAVAAEQARRAAKTIPEDHPAAVAVLPALGWIRFHVDRNMSSALNAFEQCAHLPHDPCTTRWRVAFALSRAHWEEAERLLESALRVDPFSPWLHAQLAWCWHLARKPEKSLEQALRSVELFADDEGTGLYGVIVLAYNGQAERALKLAERLSQSTPNCDIVSAAQAYALACAGQLSEAAAIVETLQWLSRERYVSNSFTPAVCQLLGDTEGAINELRAAKEARCPWFFQMLADPRLDPLHNHPEFMRMRASLDEMEAIAARERILREELMFGRLMQVNR
jgi:transcriptional regulator HilA, main transcriptional regulator of SPI1